MTASPSADSCRAARDSTPQCTLHSLLASFVNTVTEYKTALTNQLGRWSAFALRRVRNRYLKACGNLERLIEAPRSRTSRRSNGENVSCTRFWRMPPLDWLEYAVSSSLITSGCPSALVASATFFALAPPHGCNSAACTLRPDSAGGSSVTSKRSVAHAPPPILTVALPVYISIHSTLDRAESTHF
ncbi:hypothetical protein BDV95DRAFT_592535 [Massariosphaeria phaeospora]|uniref:Uncharacterized protein n=1 Tax=Massariosphaeria phaeospora TaxID=100035 RepID=A0A7C8MCR4_9PLEO|nr:hypothetical protein BDV95DRAFT_592535 [Massariosphaeria phaeospora]